ncbi:MAG: hypothetical protein ACFFCZ_13345 [Promethearchaeota archaeon]
MSEEKNSEQESVETTIIAQEKPPINLLRLFILISAGLILVAAAAWAIFLFPELISISTIIEFLMSPWVFMGVGLLFWGFLELGKWKNLLDENYSLIRLLWLSPTLLITTSLAIIISSIPILSLSWLDIVGLGGLICLTALLAWRAPILEPTLLFLSGQSFLVYQSVLEQRVMLDPFINTILFISLPTCWLILSAWKQKDLLFYANSFFTAFVALNAIILSAGWPLLELISLGIITAAMTWWFKRPRPDMLETEPAIESIFMRLYAAPLLVWLTTSLPACLAWVNTLLTSLEMTALFALGLGLVFIIEGVKKRGWWTFSLPVHGILLELTLVLLAIIGAENIELPIYFLQTGLMILFAICIFWRSSNFIDVIVTFSVCASLVFLPLQELFIDSFPVHELLKSLGLFSWLIFTGLLELKDIRRESTNREIDRIHWSGLAVLLSFILLSVLFGLITNLLLVIAFGVIVFGYGLFKRVLWLVSEKTAGEEILIPFAGAIAILFVGSLGGISPAWMFSTLIGLFCILIPLLELTLPRPRQWPSTGLLSALPAIFAVSLLLPNGNLAEWQVVVIISALATILGGLGMEFVSTGPFQKAERWLLLFGPMAGIILTILLGRLSFEAALIPVSVFSVTLMFWILVRKPVETEIFAISTCFPPVTALFTLFLVRTQIISYIAEISFILAWIVMSLLSNATAFLLETIPKEEEPLKIGKVFDLPVVVEAANSISLVGFYALGVITPEIFILVWGIFVLIYLGWRLIFKRKLPTQEETFVNVLVSMLVVAFFALSALIARPISLPLEFLTLFLIMQTLYITGVRWVSSISTELNLLEVGRPLFLAASQLVWCWIVQVPEGWNLLPLILVLGSETILLGVNNYRESLINEKISVWISIISAALIAIGSFFIYQSSLAGSLLNPDIDSTLLEALIPATLLVLIIISAIIFLQKSNQANITPQFSILSILSLVAFFEIGLWLELMALFTGIVILFFSLGLFAIKKLIDDKTKIRWSYVESYTFIAAIALVSLLNAFNPFNGTIIVVLGGLVVARGIFQKQREYQLSGTASLVIGIFTVFWEVWSRTFAIGVPISFLEVLSLTVVALLVTALVGLYILAKQRS